VLTACRHKPKNEVLKGKVIDSPRIGTATLTFYGYFDQTDGPGGDDEGGYSNVYIKYYSPDSIELFSDNIGCCYVLFFQP
jgi:hypothetical protein